MQVVDLSVQRNDDIDWQLLKPEIFAIIMDFFTSGQPVITGEPPPADTGTDGQNSIKGIKKSCKMFLNI